MIKASLINTKTIYFALVLTFALMGFFPLIPERYEGIVVICFLAISIVLFLLNFKKKRVLGKDFFITSSLFILFLISAVLSNEIGEGFKKIATMLSLLLFPLVFFIFLGSSKLDYLKYKAVFFNVFFLSNVFFSLLSFYLFSVYSSPKFSIKDASYFRSAVSDIPLIGDHPIYISIFLSIAILIGFTFYNFKKHLLLNILIVTGHLIIGFLLMLLMSKGVIIALMIALFVLVSKKFKKRHIIIVLGLLLMLLSLIIPSANNRFRELLKNDTYNKLSSQNSTNIRVNILKCSYKLIINKPILGYGLGDVQGALDRCYFKKNYGFKIGRYNSHNQYIFIWLSTGIIGFFLFLFLIFYYCKKAWICEDYLMLSIVIFYGIVFLFENVLSRQSGVILFAFLMNFLVMANSNQQSKRV